MTTLPASGCSPHALHDYAVLADGERGAVVGPRGDIGWLCVPGWGDDAVFSSLVGGAGSYTVTPVGRCVPGGHYEEGAMIWRGRWVTEESVVESREALAFPGEPGRAVLLRRIEAHEGTSRLRVALHPVGGYGSQPMEGVSRDDDGVWTARVGGLYLRWQGGAHARIEQQGDAGAALAMDVRLDPGDRHDLILELATQPHRDRPPDPARLWDATERAWADAVPALDRTVAPRDARRSYAVMRGLTASSGGMVAAATTSLPERAEEGRNYDYRYVWIRDQCYTGQAVAAAGPHPLLDDAVRFVAARLRADGPELKPAYTSGGGPVPRERRLDLPGYPGGYDLVGNRAEQQFQLDAFGEALLLFAAAARHDRLDGDGWKAARIAADAIAQRWREPDAGIWEIGDRHWTHSRLICAAGLRGVAAVAPGGSEGLRGHEWSALADTVIRAVGKSSVHPDGHWQRAPDDPATDAALLLPPIRGALPAADPRTLATLRRYREELTDDHYAYRFRHDDRPLAAAEGAFLLCGFVMALAEHQQRRTAEAFRWFERNRASCGAAGLYAEEFDIEQRQLRGNLPQAFVHALLLECAADLADAPKP